jgi:hypothetical protein
MKVNLTKRELNRTAKLFIFGGIILGMAITICTSYPGDILGQAVYLGGCAIAAAMFLWGGWWLTTGYRQHKGA